MDTEGLMKKMEKLSKRRSQEKQIKGIEWEKAEYRANTIDKHLSEFKDMHIDDRFKDKRLKIQDMEYWDKKNSDDAPNHEICYNDSVYSRLNKIEKEILTIEQGRSSRNLAVVVFVQEAMRRIFDRKMPQEEYEFLLKNSKDSIFDNYFKKAIEKNVVGEFTGA